MKHGTGCYNCKPEGRRRQDDSRRGNGAGGRRAGSALVLPARSRALVSEAEMIEMSALEASAMEAEFTIGSIAGDLLSTAFSAAGFIVPLVLFIKGFTDAA